MFQKILDPSSLHLGLLQSLNSPRSFQPYKSLPPLSGISPPFPIILSSASTTPIAVPSPFEYLSPTYREVSFSRLIKLVHGKLDHYLWIIYQSWSDFFLTYLNQHSKRWEILWSMPQYNWWLMMTYWKFSNLMLHQLSEKYYILYFNWKLHYFAIPKNICWKCLK